MRLFIAFPVSDEVKKETVRLQTELGRLNPRVHFKWVENYNLHLTLEFLGEVAEERVGGLKKILSEVVSRHQSFNYWLDHLDGFPNLNRPNILVIKARGERHNGQTLGREIYQALRQAGFIAQDHPWEPHLTLARIKNGAPLGPVVIRGLELNKIVWPITQLELIESQLLPQGPKYTVLEIFKLKS